MQESSGKNWNGWEREERQMALYAMGDFHLAFSTGKTMEVFGDEWNDYVNRIEKNCRKCLRPEDTIVITGDHSWGRNLKECEPDLKFIEDLPGRKILLRGNHDRFWDSKKTEKLNQMFAGRLRFLQNNFEVYEDYALVGTKGYCYEGKDSEEHFLKIRNREIERLKTSFELAKAAGYQKFLMFLHYPPTSIGEQKSPFTQMAEEYGAEKVIYSHCHGRERYDDSFKGVVDGVEYLLVSSDYLKFHPQRIL